MLKYLFNDCVRWNPTNMQVIPPLFGVWFYTFQTHICNFKTVLNEWLCLWFKASSLLFYKPINSVTDSFPPRFSLHLSVFTALSTVAFREPLCFSLPVEKRGEQLKKKYRLSPLIHKPLWKTGPTTRIDPFSIQCHEFANNFFPVTDLPSTLKVQLFKQTKKSWDRVVMKPHGSGDAWNTTCSDHLQYIDWLIDLFNWPCFVY